MSKWQAAPGEVLENKYRIVRQIGEGGMGAVYEAEAIRLRRRVAIKVLHGESSNMQELAARFELEAQAAGRIGSRHIVDVLDLGQLPSGANFMVMEYLDGESLRARIERAGPLPARTICAIADQLLEGLGAAHAAGIIHRDLKPDNVFLSKQPDGTDFVKLLDFGISKFNTRVAGEPASDAPSLTLTSTGTFLGTPYYLAPEQANGSAQVDQRTDLYAVGVIFYECLTGALPYSASSFNELLFRIVLEPPVPIQERVPSVDRTFAALVEQAMSKKPSERFQSAAEMQQAFQSFAFKSSAGSTLAESPDMARGRVSTEPPRTPWGTPRPSDKPAHRTMEPWAQSRSSLADDLLPRKNHRKLGVVAGALLFVGAGGIALWLMVGTGLAPNTDAAGASAPLSAAANSVASATAPPAANSPPEPLAEPSPPVAPDSEVQPTSEPRPDVVNAAPRVAPPRRVLAGARVPVHSGSTHVEAAAPAPASPQPEPSPALAAPAPANTESRTKSGRIIRTDL